MSKLAPFTLIYDGDVPSRETDQAEPEALKALTKEPLRPASGPQDAGEIPDLPPPSAAQMELFAKLDSMGLNPDLRRTIAYSCETKNAVNPGSTKLVNDVEPVVKELERQTKVTTVALWDLDARVGNLPALLKPLNKSQAELTFFDLQGAPLPAGLLGTPEFMAEWIHSKIKRKPARSGEAVIGEHLNSNAFYEGAAIIHKRTGVDYLVGISPFLIAGETDDEIFWNHFSDVKDRLLLVSTHGIRELSEQAGRPVEVGIAVLVIATLAIAMNRRLAYHRRGASGCLIDDNNDRNNIVGMIRDLTIDFECLEKFENKNRDPFLALLGGLRNYKESKHADVEAVDNDYWLGQLDKLSEAS